MARPQRLGLDYFPLDSNFFHSPDIKSLKRRHGTAGICVYLYLVAQIYEDKGYYCEYNEDTVLTLADELGMKEGAVRQVLTYCFGRSLLVRIDSSGTSTRPTPVTVITSAGIQRRWQAAKSDSGRKTPIRVDSRFWLLGPEETESFILCTLEGSFSGKNSNSSRKNSDSSGKETLNKSKVKKSKEKDIYSEAISSPAAIIDREQKVRSEAAEKLGEAAVEPFMAFITSREEAEGRQVNPSRIKGYMTRLSKMADTPAERARIARHATEKHWKGFFPVEEEKPKTPGRKPAGSFDNFEGRQYDSADMERRLLLSQDWQETVNRIHAGGLSDREREAIDWKATTADFEGRRIHYLSGESLPLKEWEGRQELAPVTAVNFTR